MLTLLFQGNEEKALIVLQKIYKINNPNDPKNYLVAKIVEDLDSLHENSSQETSNPLLILMNQTKILFSPENYKKTILVCLVQFLMYCSCHGLYMFFPEIVDQVEAFAKESSKSTICEILSANENNAKNVTCSEKIEVGTFGFSLIMEVLYMVGFLAITFIINRVTKLSILLTILFGCSLHGFFILFVDVPLVSIYLYIIFMLTFLGVNIVCAATCNLYPTKFRGLAINVTMMFGRIGSVVGTFAVGRMLDNNCEATFGTSAGLMFLSGVLSVFIPEIRKVEGRTK